MNISDYKRKVIKHFQKFYDGVDEGHGVNHVIQVTNLALSINKDQKIGISEYDIVVAGIAHDIFSYTDRDEHHTKAMEYIMSDTGDIYNYITNQKQISYAVGEHRASFKGEYNSMLSELISAADRGLPNLSSVIKRIYKCALDPSLIFAIEKTGIPNMVLSNGNTLKEMHEKLVKEHSVEFAKTYVHLCEKFSIHGYARYNDIYKKAFKEELCDMWDEIESIVKSPDKLYTYLKGC